MGATVERAGVSGEVEVCVAAAHRDQARSARSLRSCGCASRTLSKLKLGKQTGTGAERTFEDDGRPREPHVLKPLASRKADEKGSRTPHNILEDPTFRHPLPD